MAKLIELCRLLAEGTGAQKRRAWTMLTTEGHLWRGCAEVLGDPDALRRLETCHSLLSSGWSRGPLVPDAGHSPEALSLQIAAARRLIAAASVVASLIERPEEPEGASTWAARSVNPDGPGLASTESSALPERGIDLVRCAYDRAARRFEHLRPELAASRDAALTFLRRTGLAPEERVCIHRLRVPVLLARGSEGFRCWLWLERLEDGIGELFQAPESSFDPLLADLRGALQSVWSGVGELLRPDEDIRWWLSDLPREDSGAPVPLNGASLQAAAWVAVQLLLQGAEYAPHCAISATLDRDGHLRGVSGFTGAAAKLHAAQRLRPLDGSATVIVSPEDELPPVAAAEWLRRGVTVRVASTAQEALELARRPGNAPAAGTTEPTVPPHALPALAVQRIVILFRRGVFRDQQIATGVGELLAARGYRVFRDEHPEVGLEWARGIDREVRMADLVIPILSPESASDEMLIYGLHAAREAAAQRGLPRLLPISIRQSAPLPDGLGALVDLDTAIPWDGGADLSPLLAEVLRRVRQAPPGALPPDPAHLTPPTGVLPLGSVHYVERPCDHTLRLALSRRDSIVRIKGARQMGKTSLLARGLQQARAAGAVVLLTDLQSLNAAALRSAEAFFTAIARSIARQLNLDISPEELWDPLQGPNANFRDFLLEEVLSTERGPVVWGLDEVDRLFHCDFGTDVFALFRSWHNERALNPAMPWSRLTLAMSYATEAHLFISDLNQSPFNVGTRIPLQDLTREEVAELSVSYGRVLSREDDVSALHELLGGHPYLTNRGLYEMVTTGAELATFARNASQEGGVFGDHLQRLLVTLSRDAELVDAVRELLRGRPCPSSEVYFRLWSGGVVSGESARDARLRCPLYAEYLRRHLL